MEYITIQECIASNLHLSDCDSDGYCNLCGRQENTIDENGNPTFTEDIDSD